MRCYFNLFIILHQDYRVKYNSHEIYFIDTQVMFSKKNLSRIGEKNYIQKIVDNLNKYLIKFLRHLMFYEVLTIKLHLFWS